MQVVKYRQLRGRVKMEVIKKMEEVLKLENATHYAGRDFTK